MEAASLTFSLGQTLEMKVLSKRDTSGVKKVKLIDELSISGSYNLIADSMGLSNLPLRLRSTIIKNFGINISATLDPYEVTPEGQRINKLMWRRGLPGRIVNASTSFGYTFNSRSDNSVPAINDINSIDPLYQNPFYDPYGQMDPVLRRQYMAQTYYDFSLPWNLGFTYSINYGISYVNNGTTGYKKTSSKASTSTATSTSRRRRASRSKAVSTSPKGNSRPRRSPSRAICIAGRCPFRGFRSASTAAGASTSA